MNSRASAIPGPGHRFQLLPEIVRATPKPDHWIAIRFEDFILDQDRTLKRLSRFLDIELTRIPVRTQAVGRWKTDPAHRNFDFLEPDLIEFGYLAP